jgi:DNA-binding NtrC family response regulator
MVTLLASYDFPGNIRELQTIIFDTLITHTSKVLSLSRIRKHISRRPHIKTSPAPDDVFGECVFFPAKLPKLKEIAELLVREAMNRARGNQSVAANMLGISPAAISKRLKKNRTEQ